MCTKSLLRIKWLMLLVIMFSVNNCDCRGVVVNKRKTGGFSEVQPNYITENYSFKNKSGSTAQGRGFFGHGIFALGKVLNFFPVGGERECQPSQQSVARAGICLNAYDCRQRDGKAAGDCAHGLGVCCVFEVTCGGTVQHNLTYFMSPGFPEIWNGDEEECTVTVEKAFAGIMQLRIDFVHFTIGQPNRKTGDCNEDALIIGEGKNNFTICGQNHGQHLYYTLPTALETRETGDLPSVKSIKLRMLMRGSEMPRLWLLRLAQMPLAHSAPHGCLQYYTSNNGTIKTFNYASNGRHLANQDYKACIRRNSGHCGIRYTPCDNKSFRIGPSGDPVIDPYNEDTGPGSYGGPGTGFYGPDGSFVGPPLSTTLRATTVADFQSAETQNATTAPPQQQQEQDEMDYEDILNDDEGSGSEPEVDSSQSATSQQTKRPSKTFMEVMWSYIWPSWLWGQSRTLSWRWSPYTQHYKQDSETDDFRYYGYGNFGAGLLGFGRQRCQDRITIPCESEYFVSSLPYGSGVCDPHHCGNTFCPGQSHQHCRVETSITPFAVSFHFGPPTVKRSPEDNIGVCLKFQQMPCET